MNTILWIFIAFAFGLMLFVSIQDDIPDELSFLKPSVVETTGPNGSSVKEYMGWTIRQAGQTVELTKRFVEVDKTSRMVAVKPEVGILCNNGQLDMRINSIQKTTGISDTPVVLGDLPEALWQKSSGTNVFPRQPKEALSALLKQPSVPLTLSYVDSGLRRFTLDAQGLKPLVDQLPPGCRG